MTSDNIFNMACMTMIASLFGLALVFAGYKLFRIVLPIWAFFFGFLVGAQWVQVIFNVGFLTTITGWVVGLLFGLLFAVLAYPFYLLGVGIIAGSLGYLVALSVMLWLGLPFGFFTLLIAIVAAIAMIIVTFIFNLQRWVIIIGSTVIGAGVITGVITLLFKPHAVYLENPIKTMLQLSPMLLILFLALVILGIIVQLRTTRSAYAAVSTTSLKSTMAPDVVAGATAPGAVAAGATGAAVVGEALKASAPVEPVSQEAITPPVTAMEVAPATVDALVSPLGPAESEKFKYNLEYIEGIGPVYAGKLRAIGINNPFDLLEKGAFPKGRGEIAAAAGISPTLVLTWVNHVDLFRIKGVGSEYADLLEVAGVDTVVELSKRNPENLFAKMLEVNMEKKLVRKPPVLTQVQDWVEQAKLLPRKINY
jgi:predicted flap endonuclease-1-like 5' DNA nuclease